MSKPLQYHLDLLLPGEYMIIKKDMSGNSSLFYNAVEEGVTSKGISWNNVHISYRENATYSVRDRTIPWLIGSGIDIGCGKEKVMEGCVGVDSNDDYGDQSDADVVCDATDLAQFESDSFDWAFSSNCLEHIGNWEKALSEWVRVVGPGGIIFLYLPWPDKCYPHSSENTPGHLWNPSPGILRVELERRGVDILEQDSEPDRWGCFVIIGRKRG